MKNAIGERMKNNYENVTRYNLVRRMPVIIRLDMRAGHTFTKNMEKPYDSIFAETMYTTALELCRQISNAKFAYVQSDEISILLIDYAKLTTNQWFNANIQKIASVSASIATLEFNVAFMSTYLREQVPAEKQYIYNEKINKATFDSRVFNIPESEVCNYFIWRQQDATNNSILSLSYANFSQEELQNVSTDKLQDMLMLQKGINWNDQIVPFKRGVGIIQAHVHDQANNIDKDTWIINRNIPIFTQDRNYIDDLLIEADSQ